MRPVLRRLLRNDRISRQLPGTEYRSGSYQPLSPAQVRAHRFTPVGFGRQGVDPVEVAQFLDQVAGDLVRAYAELAMVREQNARIKDALRRWQSRQTLSADEMVRR